MEVKSWRREKLFNQEQVGWLNPVGNDQLSELKLKTGEKGVYFVL